MWRVPNPRCPSYGNLGMIPRAFLFDQLPTPLASKTHKQRRRETKQTRQEKKGFIHSFTLKPIFITSNRFSSSYTTKAHTIPPSICRVTVLNNSLQPTKQPFRSILENLPLCQPCTSSKKCISLPTFQQEDWTKLPLCCSPFIWGLTGKSSATFPFINIHVEGNTRMAIIGQKAKLKVPGSMWAGYRFGSQIQ